MYQEKKIVIGKDLRFSKITFLILNIFLSAICFAQTPGSLDSTFYPGRIITGFGTGDDYGLDAAVQPDGKIIAAGYTNNNGNFDFAVTRYNVDGTLDKTFGVLGQVTSAIGNSTDFGRAIAIQADGKILVAGCSYNGAMYDFAIIRYLPNGTLDNTFSGDGKVTTSFGGHSNINSIVVQSNGKIVVAGDYETPSGSDFALARYNSNGTLDVTFDGDGKVITMISGVGDDVAQSVALQADGKIVAAGYFYNISDSIAIVRYNTNGSLDATFDGDGKVYTLIGGGYCHVYSVAIQADGRIVAGGYSLGAIDYDFTLVRYNANGSLDSTFDGDGKVTTQAGGNGIIYSLALQPDGKIVAGGYSGDPQKGFSLARYNNNGSLDTAFDTDGMADLPIGASEDRVRSVAVRPDGKIVAVGYTDNFSFDFAAARFNADGSPDGTFGNRVITAFGDVDDEATGTAIQTDGKIVVVGFTHNGLNRDFAVARYLPDGMPDTAFGTQGKVITPIGSGIDSATGVALQADGKIVVAGFSAVDQTNHFAVVRYNTNGSLDTSFALTGKVVTPVGASSSATSVAIQGKGKIVVGGTACLGPSCDFAAVRYNTNGSLDASFDGDGKVTTSIGPGFDTAYSMAIQADGKIVLAGNSNDGSGNDFALVRYNSNGSLDTGFDNDGRVVTEMGSTSDTIRSIAIQPDGNIVAAGYGRDMLQHFDFALARYRPDGSLDMNFDTDGRVQTDFFPGSSETAYTVALQPDGKIVAAGQRSDGIQTTGDTAFVQYNPDGSLDLAFGNDGKAVIPIGGRDEAIFDIAIENGKIVGVGSVTNGSYDNFAVIRLNGRSDGS